MAVRVMRRKAIGPALVGIVLLVLMPRVIGWLVSVPYVGAQLAPGTERGFLVLSVDPGSSAAEAGIRSGHLLLSVGEIGGPTFGESDDPRVFELRIMNRYRASAVVSWRSQVGESRVEIESALERLPTPIIFTHIVLYLPFLATAFVLLWTTGRDPRVRHLALLIFMMTAGNFFRPITDMAIDTPGGFLLQEVCAIGRFLGPAMLVHFALIFPARTLSATARARVLTLAYGIPFALFVIEQTVIFRGALDPEAPYLMYTGVLQRVGYFQIRFAVFLASFVTAGLLMVHSYRRVRGRKARNQVKWVVWSVLLAGGLDTVIIASSWVAGAPYSDITLGPYRNLLYLVLAAALIIAILRYDLFDVDRVVRTSIVYFGTTGSMFFVFALTEGLVSGVLEGVMADQGRLIATGVGGVITAALFLPAWRLFEQVARRTQGVRHEDGAPPEVDPS